MARVGPGEEVLGISWVEWGRVRKLSNIAGQGRDTLIRFDWYIMARGDPTREEP